MSYNGGNVDALLKSLDRRVERLMAVQGSFVKLRAAERDLLQDVEQARDLCNKAVKGDKDHLNSIFGANGCERIGRLRLMLDTVVLSDMHAADARWVHLGESCLTIEKVLEDLGSYKPWKPAAVPAVEAVKYKVRRRFSPGRHVNLKPDIFGGEATLFAVEPALPADLSLDPNTGHITGVVKEAVPEATYKVTASNESGEATAELVFSVLTAHPTLLSYPTARDVTTGEDVAFEPVVEGGFPNHFTLKHALPAGLDLDEETGVIAGKALAPAESFSYTVTASNGGGEVEAVVTFGVNLAPPSALRYPGLAESYTTGDAVTVPPEVVGTVDEFSVEPALPPGLSLNAVTGDLTGMPSEVCDTGTWTVVARNGAGEVATEISFAVKRAPPKGLSYPGLVPEYAHGRQMMIHPTVQGEVFEWAVDPALPDGLVLGDTGVISGTPVVSTGAVSYEVTAKNDAGSTTATLEFAVKVLPPTNLNYPSLDPTYSVGESVHLSPEVDGGATHFAVEPPLPEGLSLDEAAGVISGAPSAITAEPTDHIVTASNEGGSTETTLTFSVIEAAPTALTYPTLSSVYTVGEEVTLEPEQDALGCEFAITPVLPEGLVLDTRSGVIAGVPTTEAEGTKYVVTARNRAGETSAELIFTVQAKPEEDIECSIDVDFARLIEETTDIAELCAEPNKNTKFGDWMIWMVHRAWLDDPSLIDFNFNNMHMPPPHMEVRIAPKLMKALAKNTHIENLSLANSNLQKPQGHELADALLANRKLKYVNIETNNLDSACLTDIANALATNVENQVEHIRTCHQKQMGNYFGRPVEKAMSVMVEKNKSLLRLGFVCQDAHWRNTIDRALLRNNDAARRRRKRNSSMAEEMIPQEEKTLGKVVLKVPPAKSRAEAFGEDTPAVHAFCGFTAEHMKLPTPPQLQSFANNMGQSIPYKELKPSIEKCREKMLNAAITTEVEVLDTCAVSHSGPLWKWSVVGQNWMLDIIVRGEMRHIYKGTTDPAFEISEECAAWLRAGRGL